MVFALQLRWPILRYDIIYFMFHAILTQVLPTSTIHADSRSAWQGFEARSLLYRGFCIRIDSHLLPFLKNNFTDITNLITVEPHKTNRYDLPHLFSRHSFFSFGIFNSCVGWYRVLIRYSKTTTASYDMLCCRAGGPLTPSRSFFCRKRWPRSPFHPLD